MEGTQEDGWGMHIVNVNLQNVAYRAPKPIVEVDLTLSEWEHEHGALGAARQCPI